MPPRKLFFENVRLGDEIPAVAKSPVDRVQICRYAGAIGDYAPHHVDEVFAKSIGMPSVFAHSTLGMGFLAQVLTDWSRGAVLTTFNVRYAKLIWPGDTLVCRGRVTDRWGTQGRYFVEIEMWAENQKGELVLKGNAVLKVFLSTEDEARQKAGHGPIVHEVQRESLRLLAAQSNVAADKTQKTIKVESSSKPAEPKPRGKLKFLKPDPKKAKR